MRTYLPRFERGFFCCHTIRQKSRSDVFVSNRFFDDVNDAQPIFRLLHPNTFRYKNRVNPLQKFSTLSATIASPAAIASHSE
jgi:hypothetical protein